MKKIEAYIRPEKFDAVKKALAKKGQIGMSVMHIKGRGKQGGIKLSSRVGNHVVDMLDKVKIEIFVNSDGVLDEIVDTIADKACTKTQGDGKIFISPVETVVRIRDHSCDEKTV